MLRYLRDRPNASQRLNHRAQLIDAFARRAAHVYTQYRLLEKDLPNADLQLERARIPNSWPLTDLAGSCTLALWDLELSSQPISCLLMHWEHLPTSLSRNQADFRNPYPTAAKEIKKVLVSYLKWQPKNATVTNEVIKQMSRMMMKKSAKERENGSVWDLTLSDAEKQKEGLKVNLCYI